MGKALSHARFLISAASALESTFESALESALANLVSSATAANGAAAGDRDHRFTEACAERDLAPAARVHNRAREHAAGSRAANL